ncbi:hypothetical protein AXG93_1502s1420 [Marchantia polymorpha subsp. ruderalis]|uniref:Uncharacterized protein n=1 Tax=Marchantia polymorpha subsp. ruderalis TaxID=1480154 RepID=A0A176WCX6_MARPO|nr:hypothetical protein AXG93_1502s1420 [Marchantia polymorpha subsp. ruderalis]
MGVHRIDLPKRYKVSSKTRASASHLKEKHGKLEEINCKDLTFAFPTGISFQGYAEFPNLEEANHLLASSSTVKAWIMEAYAAQKDEMLALLHAAP